MPPPPPPPITLLDHLAKLFSNAKRQTIRRMIADGRVRVNGVRATRATQVVGPNDNVDVSDQAARPASRAARSHPPGLDIVFEDEDLLVINKPAGLLTSTVPKEKRPTALALVRAYVADTSPRSRVGLIHRLDRDAAGLLVFSKSHTAYESLKTQFFKHTVDRVYEATVHGKPNPPAGTIDTHLLERADGTVHSTDRHAKGQRAITHYETIETTATKPRRSRLRVRLQTGRKHQIRVHLSERGCPIVGDAVYGAADDSPPLKLAAVELAFDHPRTGKRVSFRI